MVLISWLSAAAISWRGGGAVARIHVPHPLPLSLPRHTAVVANLPAIVNDDEFEVTIARPLGITLKQQEGMGPVVATVYEGSNAALNGVAPGDIVIATSASIGESMWPKMTVAGVESAIQTRLDGRVRLRLRRPGTKPKRRILPWEGTLLHTYEVELSRPLGMVLRQREVASSRSGGGSGDASSSGSSRNGMSSGSSSSSGVGASVSVSASRDGAPPAGGGGSGRMGSCVEVADVSAGGSAHASGLVQPGDVVLATSGTVGDALWEKSSLEGVLAALSTRLALQQTVTVRLQRAQTLGPWARELWEVARGQRTTLSAGARVALRAQWRARRRGILVGSAVDEALRDLAVQAVLAFGRRAKGSEATASSSDEARRLERLLRRMRAASVPLNSRFATAAMSAALRVRRPDMSLRLFEQLDGDGLAPDAQVYTTLIKTHGAAGSLPEALAVEQRMSAERVEPTLNTYITLMSVCARAGDRRGMLKYFGRISERGMKPTVEAWNVVLSYCAQMEGPSRVVQAEDVMRRMREQGLAPDAVSYSSLVQAYVRNGEAERFDELLERMRGDGVLPDLVLLNTLLNGYGRTLRWERAFELLRAWERDGVRPDATSYTHVLRACVGARLPERAAAAVEMMRQAGLTPDVRTYSMLLSAYAKAGMLRASLATLKTMRSEGVRPNRYIYAGLMDVCLVAGQPETASQLFEQMKGQGVPADATSYTLLIRALLAPSTRGTSEDGTSLPQLALGVFAEMQSLGGDCTPNRLTYNALLDGCLDFGEDDLALEVLGKMLDARISPDRLTYAALAGSAEPQRRRQQQQQKGAQSPQQRGEQGGPVRVPRPPAPTVAVLLRVVQLFALRRQRLGGDVYLAALAAAEQTGDGPAARQFIHWRQQGVFQLRRQDERRAAAAEASASVGGAAAVRVEEEEWVERTAEDAEAMGIDGNPVPARLKRGSTR